TASSLPAVQSAQLRSRSSLRPWKRPASIMTRLPELVVSRWRDPVTVCAAPRKVRVVTSPRLSGGGRPAQRHVGSRGRAGRRRPRIFARPRGAEVRAVRLESAYIEYLFLLRLPPLQPLPGGLRVGEGVGVGPPARHPRPVVGHAQHLPPERVVEPVEVL